MDKREMLERAMCALSRKEIQRRGYSVRQLETMDPLKPLIAALAEKAEIEIRDNKIAIILPIPPSLGPPAGEAGSLEEER